MFKDGCSRRGWLKAIVINVFECKKEINKNTRTVACISRYLQWSLRDESFIFYPNEKQANNPIKEPLGNIFFIQHVQRTLPVIIVRKEKKNDALASSLT